MQLIGLSSIGFSSGEYRGSWIMLEFGNALYEIGKTVSSIDNDYCMLLRDVALVRKTERKIYKVRCR